MRKVKIIVLLPLSLCCILMAYLCANKNNCAKQILSQQINVINYFLTDTRDKAIDVDDILRKYHLSDSEDIRRSILALRNMETDDYNLYHSSQDFLENAQYKVYFSNNIEVTFTIYQSINLFSFCHNSPPEIFQVSNPSAYTQLPKKIPAYSQ